MSVRSTCITRLTQTETWDYLAEGTSLELLYVLTALAQSGQRVVWLTSKDCMPTDLPQTQEVDPTIFFKAWQRLRVKAAYQYAKAWNTLYANFPSCFVEGEAQHTEYTAGLYWKAWEQAQHVQPIYQSKTELVAGKSVRKYWARQLCPKALWYTLVGEFVAAGGELLPYAEYKNTSFIDLLTNESYPLQPRQQLSASEPWLAKAYGQWPKHLSKMRVAAPQAHTKEIKDRASWATFVQTRIGYAKQVLVPPQLVRQLAQCYGQHIDHFIEQCYTWHGRFADPTPRSIAAELELLHHIGYVTRWEDVAARGLVSVTFFEEAMDTAQALWEKIV